MAVRFNILLFTLGVFVPPASGQSQEISVSITEGPGAVSVSAGLPGVSIGVEIEEEEPAAPVVVHPPPPVVVQPPVPAVVVPAPPAPTVVVPAPPPPVVVQPVPAPPVVVQPVEPAPIATVQIAAEQPEPPPDTVDLLAFGSYRHVLDWAKLGGAEFAARLSYSDHLAGEVRVGYFGGPDSSLGHHVSWHEVVFDFATLYYPWQRGAPLYLGFRLGLGFADKDPAFGSPNREGLFLGTRGVVGLEFGLLELLVVAVEGELLYRVNLDSPWYHEAGYCLNAGLGIRLSGYFTLRGSGAATARRIPVCPGLGPQSGP